MIVGFTGTQKGMTAAQLTQAYSILGIMDLTHLHHGDCIGADNQAHSIALSRKCEITIHPPVNNTKRAFCHNKITTDTILHVKRPLEYLERNHNIVDESEALVATPGENQEQLRSGTWATIRYAKKRGKEIIIIFPDGNTEVIHKI